MKKFEISISNSNFDLLNIQNNFEIEISISVSISISTKIFENFEIFRFRPVSIAQANLYRGG